jgi:hypothetical protein
MSEWDNVGPINVERKLKALLQELDVVGEEWIEIRKDVIVGPNRILGEVKFAMKPKTPKRVRQKMDLLKKKIYGLKLADVPRITITEWK